MERIEPQLPTSPVVSGLKVGKWISYQLRGSGSKGRGPDLLFTITRYPIAQENSLGLSLGIFQKKLKIHGWVWCVHICMLCVSIFKMLRLPSLFHFYCVFFILFVLCMHVGAHIHAITHWEVRGQLAGVSSLLPLHDFPCWARSTHLVASSFTPVPSHGPLDNHFHAIAPECLVPLSGGFRVLVVLPLNDVSHFRECPFVAFVFSPLLPWSMKQEK